MADPLAGAGHFAPSSYLSAFKPSSALSPPFRLDEGYSEDTRSQSDNDTAMRLDARMGDAGEQEPGLMMLPDWVLSLSETGRSDFAYAILRSLRTSSMAAIVERLNPLLHLDPVHHLPPEITFQIFSYLDPSALLRASTLSRSWRIRALDSRLWRRMFADEGWAPNVRQLRAYEEAQRLRHSRKSRARRADDPDRHATRKRARDGTSSAVQGTRSNSTTPDETYDSALNWGEQHGAVEADESPSSGADEDRMQDVSFHGQAQSLSQERRIDDHVSSYKEQMDVLASHTLSSSNPLPPDPSLLGPPVTPKLLDTQPGNPPKLNWLFLYKQKRKLEENWNAGRFANFQLPHPRYAHEAHKECVYTIQYSGQYLVSGSRDQTIRIWDLNTQRLKVPPLMGHTASVLCLQFDESPEQDIVISGGSDCHVLLWRFSTGELIRKLEKAHSESVLNLRFDDRYLITCSKDKTIKVWNRKELMPTDDTYPTPIPNGGRFPAYIISLQQYQEQHLRIKPLKEYSLLMTLDGHGAAVNAIQIYNDQIVSASGDRTVKAWDVRSGACLMSFIGHTKGIACVQFDGRRVVSGSSDNSVRIFDRATGAEVACLLGHSNLVRTVQARFGDLPGHEAELEAEARAHDRSVFQAALDNPAASQLAGPHTSRLADRTFLALGAKLPPGGGGSRWARIVSGSYDETVIIWRKNEKGRWVPATKLRQGDAVRAAGGRMRAHPVALQQQQQQQQNALAVGQAAPGSSNGAAATAGAVVDNAQQPAQPSSAIPPQVAQFMLAQQQQQASAQAAAQGQSSSSAQPAAQSNQQTQVHTQTPTMPQAASGSNVVAAFHPANIAASQLQPQFHPTSVQPPNPPVSAVAIAQGVAQSPTAATQQSTQIPAAAAASVPALPVGTTPVITTTTTTTPAGPATATATAPAVPTATTTTVPVHPVVPAVPAVPAAPHHHHHHHHHHAHALAMGPMPQQGSNARVFKLQFDSRRIICCSQDPIIVGWDFANGDREIVQASRFFGETV